MDLAQSHFSKDHKWLINNKDAVINEIDVIDFKYNAWYNVDQTNKENLI